MRVLLRHPVNPGRQLFPLPDEVPSHQATHPGAHSWSIADSYWNMVLGPNSAPPLGTMLYPFQPRLLLLWGHGNHVVCPESDHRDVCTEESLWGAQAEGIVCWAPPLRLGHTP